MSADHPSSTPESSPTRRRRQRLQELIAAVDRRVQDPTRASEASIAADAAALRLDAETQLAALNADAIDGAAAPRP